MRTVTILGATGSVGQQTLDVVRLYPEGFSVCALTAKRGSETLAQLCAEFKPTYAVVSDAHEASKLRDRIAGTNLSTQILVNQDQPELEPIFAVDVVVTSIVGSAGLQSTLRAIKAGSTVLITNKEPVVMLGSILREEVRKYEATVVPVDSEHNAIFQCCYSKSGERYECFFPINGLRRILLTGSGGPFRQIEPAQMKDITPEQAIAHPIWNMGPKISVDSATMMNKGLEVIEARWLFDTPADQIDVVVHPQGIVHSMVEYLDGSVLAQMATPDMRVPLTFGLFWPQRVQSSAERLDVFDLPALRFEPPDYVRFPCLKLARSVAESSGTAPTVMNAANEVAVDAFLASKIRFTDIYTVVAYCVDQIGDHASESIDQVLESDENARKVANKKVRALSEAKRSQFHMHGN